MADDMRETPGLHDAPASVFRTPQPLIVVDPAPRRTPAEEARTLLSQASIGTLASLSHGGDPWASLVGFAPLADGTPVLLVSTLAEHGRNLVRDPRAGLSYGESAQPGGDPLDVGRVSLAGHVVEPQGDERARALAAYHEAFPSSKLFAEFGDFTLWVLRVERVRWVGGFGRMDSVSADAFHAAEADPVAGSAAYAASHMNEDHADALLLIGQHVAGHLDAESVVCKRADRYGMDLWVKGPRGEGPARAAFAEPVTAPDGLRAAAVELTKRARAAASA